MAGLDEQHRDFGNAQCGAQFNRVTATGVDQHVVVPLREIANFALKTFPEFLHATNSGRLPLGADRAPKRR